MVGTRLDAIEDVAPLQATPASLAQQLWEKAARLAESRVRQAQAAREGFERR